MILIHSTLESGYDFYINDKRNKKYHFKISTFPVPSGLLSEAYQVITDSFKNEPRVFHVLSDYDTDIEKAELILKEKVKRAIDIRYLDYKDGQYSIGKNMKIAGSIQCNNTLQNSDFDYCLAIDGKKFTIEEFVKLLSPYEGFNFKFQIIDQSDEID
jgi:hypothetical protein